MHIRTGTVVCAVFLAGAAFAQPGSPASEDATGLVLQSTTGEFSGRVPTPSEPIAEVRPGETLTYRIRAQALSTGAATVDAALQADGLPAIRQQTTTTVVAQ